MLHRAEGGPTLNASLVSSLEPFREKWLPSGIRKVACGLAEVIGGPYICGQESVVNAAYHGKVTPSLSPFYSKIGCPNAAPLFIFLNEVNTPIWSGA